MPPDHDRSPRPDPDPLWRVAYADSATFAAGYGYDNHRRMPDQPRGVIQYTIAGRLDWWDDDGHRSIGPDELVLFTLDERSRFARDVEAGPYTCCWLSLAGMGIDACWRGLIATYGRIHGPDSGAVCRAMQCLDTTSPAAAVHRFVADLHGWLDDLGNRHARPVDRAIRSIEQEPFRDRSVSEIAHAAGVSREHLSLVFRQRHGLPPGPWLLQRRLALARELLADGRLGLAVVAQRCGMGSARRLARALKRQARPPRG